MSEKVSVDEVVSLPVTPAPKHSPVSTKWEVRDERGALGLEPCDRVLPVSELDVDLWSGGFDHDRIHTRGRVWMPTEQTLEWAGIFSLAGETGHERVYVEEEHVMDQLSEDVGVTIRNLLANTDGHETQFVIDSETEILTWDRNKTQRYNLMSLAQVDGWPRRKRVDEPEGDVRMALEDRVESLRRDLDRYGNVTVGVRYTEPQVTRRQLYLYVGFDQLLLPRDILYVYRCVSEVDGINWMNDSHSGTYVNGVRYEVERDLREVREDRGVSERLKETDNNE